MGATLQQNVKIIVRSNRYVREHALNIPIAVGDEDPDRWNAYLDLAEKYRELAESFDRWAEDQGLI